MTRPRSLRVLVLLSALLVAACGNDTAGDEPESPEPGPATTPQDATDPNTFEEFGEVVIVITNDNGDEHRACVLLAETMEQRRQGLMGVTDLGGYAGMLFVAENERPQSFWMRDTPMPLSIAWFDDDGAYVSEADMEPFDETSHASDGPARLALEVPQGELPTFGIGPDSILKRDGACS